MRIRWRDLTTRQKIRLAEAIASAIRSQPPEGFQSCWRDFVEHYRRQQIRSDVRELAISIALELTAVEAADVLERCGLKVFDNELSEPWWVSKARELYYAAKTSRPPRLPEIARARAMLKRYGVPDIFVRLAEAIATGRCSQLNLPSLYPA